MIFDVSQQEAEVILAALSEMPYKLTKGLIDKLLEQGNSQISSEEPEE